MLISKAIIPTLLATLVAARDRGFHGLIGLGTEVYDLPCGAACYEAIAFNPLVCTPKTAKSHSHGHNRPKEPTTPSNCFATDSSFLTTLAWCISQNCQNVEVWRIEKFWRHHAVSKKIFPVPPVPKWTYQESLQKISDTPTQMMKKETLLNKTMVVNSHEYTLAWRATIGRHTMEIAHSKAALSIAVLSLGFPVVLTWLWYFLPIPGRILSRLYGTFIYPAILRNRRRVPLPFSIGYAPTYGEAIYIAILLSANVLAAAIGFKTYQPTTNYAQGSLWELAVYFGNRCGLLSLTNFMILALMAGRNNILLYITNWSHSTYLLLHRWVAYCCILEAVLHSLVWLCRATIANHNFAERVKSPYWIWGTVATVSFSLILFTSILPIRQNQYELFLVCHILLAMFALVGVWQHIWLKFTRDLGSYGFEIWIWLTAAFWALDHVVRYLRIAKNGIGRAEVTVLDDDYIQINVRDMEVEGHVYLYFPTLTWRFWESHPFSVYASALPDQTKTSKSSTPELPRSQGTSFTEDVEKKLPSVHVESVMKHEQQRLHPGFSLLVRTMGGSTKFLRDRQSLPVLVEGSYHSPKPPSPHCRLVAVAGGVGITAVLPTLKLHQGSKKLYWGSRVHSLIDQVAPHLTNMEFELALERRLDLPAILEEELQGAGSDVVVQVCGPSEMADEVRAIVSAYVRKGERNIELDDESFGW